MKRHHIAAILAVTISLLLLTACTSSDSAASSSEDILDIIETIESVDTNIFLQLDVHSGTSGLSGSHKASIESDITISSVLSPISYYCESFSRILVDSVTTREDKEYYVVLEDDEYLRYENDVETDTWTVSNLSKSEVQALPYETGFINDWSGLMASLEEEGEDVNEDDIPIMIYTGDIKADILQDLFGNNIFGSFMYSMEYLLTDEVPCTVSFELETGLPLELELDISECFIVDDMDVDHGTITVTYSNHNGVDDISVPKKVSIVASDPAQEFYSSYYIWNLFLPYMNAAGSSITAGNEGLSFEANWNTFQVRLDNGMTALPMNYSDLDNIGYEINSQYVTKTLEANKSMEFVPVTKGNDILYCTFYNDQAMEQSLTACKVVGLDLRSAECPDNNIHMFMPGEITMGVSKDTLISAYGEPDSATSGFSSDTYIWYNFNSDGSEILQQFFRAEISPVTGKVVRMYLQNVPVSAIDAASPDAPVEF